MDIFLHCFIYFRHCTHIRYYFRFLNNGFQYDLMCWHSISRNQTHGVSIRSNMCTSYSISVYICHLFQYSFSSLVILSSKCSISTLFIDHFHDYLLDFCCSCHFAINLFPVFLLLSLVFRILLSFRRFR